MINRLPLEINSRPVRITKITVKQTLKTWIAWKEENLIGILWVHARLKYGRNFFAWYQLEITRGLSPAKISQLAYALKRRAYFEGIDACQFHVYPTVHEGVCFSWIAEIDHKERESKRRQRRKRFKQGVNAEGHNPVTLSDAPSPENDNTEILNAIQEQVSCIPSYMRPKHLSRK